MIEIFVAVILVALTVLVTCAVPAFIGWHLGSWLAGIIAFVVINVYWHLAVGRREGPA